MKAKTDFLYYITAALLVVTSYFFFDLPVINFFKPLKNTFTYDFFKVVTEFGRAEYQIVPAILVYIVFRKKRPFVAKIGLAVALSSALAGLSTDVIKFIVGRYRPSMYFSEGLYGFAFFEYKYAMVSFPSGHSSTALGALGLLSLVFKRFRWVFLSIGAMIALSRVVTLHHYFSDIIAGSAIGMASAIFIYNKMKLYKGTKE
ncbi:MAG: phosphatase PAP2 family protein [Denitrovibrio sp.]|nr:MAG: phosphatase PAP2 family protein [Denitrovibrio sp.]